MAYDILSIDKLHIDLKIVPAEKRNNPVGYPMCFLSDASAAEGQKLSVQSISEAFSTAAQLMFEPILLMQCYRKFLIATDIATDYFYRKRAWIQRLFSLATLATVILYLSAVLLFVYPAR